MPSNIDKHAVLVLINIAQAEHLNGHIRRNVLDTRSTIFFLILSSVGLNAIKIATINPDFQ
jgi:hypothetical protein